MAETVEELIDEIRGGVFFQEMRELASDIRALKEYIRHLDVKLDIVQEHVEELSKSLRLREHMIEIERSIKSHARNNPK